MLGLWLGERDAQIDRYPIRSVKRKRIALNEIFYFQVTYT
jgi:hypothetical protein